MSDDLAGSASAPADTTDVSTPNPITTEPQKLPDPKPADEGKGKDGEEAIKPTSTRDALKNAAAKVAEKTKGEDDGKKPAPVDTVKAEKPVEQPKAKEEPAKVDAPKDQPAKVQTDAADKPEPVQPDTKKPHHQAPVRFKSDTAAMAEWDNAPDSVKAAVHRTVRELEAGIEKHRASAEAFEQVKDFDDLAKRNNTSLRDAMTRYTNLERTLLTDPIRGIQEVCAYAGVSFRDLAAHVMGMKPDQVQSQNDATIRELRGEIAGLKQQLGGVTNSIGQQQRSAVDQTIQDFASSHPRFEELADDIALLIESKRAKDLAEAYSLAERLNPAPDAPAPAAPQTRTNPDLQAQTLKGSKSITGAPSPGSDPAAKRAPSTSIKDSIRRAVNRVG